MMKKIVCLSLVCLIRHITWAQEMHYTIKPVLADTSYYQVVLECKGLHTDSMQFSLPAWTPGYYQLMHYASAVRNLHASNAAGKNLSWKRQEENHWTVYTPASSSITLQYEVRSARPFVATNFLEANRGFISPAGMFMHLENKIKLPVTVTVQPLAGWNLVATGLEPVRSHANTYTATDFDELYDSPLLMGKLEALPSFELQGKQHQFIAYQPGEFNREAFMQDLEKIVRTAATLMGDMPYKHYTFLAIGPSRGGIEHLNSAAVGFNGTELNKREGKIRMYNFLTHEYFHHYNVKRIRPVELGPFDYDRGSKTRMLWVSEGFTVYYEYLIMRRAGFTTQAELLQSLQKNIKAYESKPGHLLQSVAAASYETWKDGPFGAGDSSISYYDKGPVLGAFLDLKIRHETKNKRSLDDVMRALYYDFYKKGKGFTEAEFRATAEKIAGVSLAECFDYANTVKPLDYKKYFGYAGLDIAVDNASFEISFRSSPDSLQAAILNDWLRGSAETFSNVSDRH